MKFEDTQNRGGIGININTPKDTLKQNQNNTQDVQDTLQEYDIEDDMKNMTEEEFKEAYSITKKEYRDMGRRNTLMVVLILIFGIGIYLLLQYRQEEESKNMRIIKSKIEQINNSTTEIEKMNPYQNSYDINSINLLRFKGVSNELEAEYIYDVNSFKSKIKGMPIDDFIKLLINSQYNEDYNYCSPENLINKEEINCQGYTLAVIDYIETNYSKGYLNLFKPKAITEVRKNVLHMFVVYVNDEDGETFVIDLANDRNRAIANLRNLFKEISAYRLY